MSNIFDAVIEQPEKGKKDDSEKKVHNTRKGKGKSGVSKIPKKRITKKGISPETKEKAVAIVYDQNHGEKEKPAIHMDGNDKDLSKLIERSSRAELMKPIQLEELQRFKIEQSKMLLLKAAGDLAEVEFMKFVYLGYMEKISIDLLRMTKKLETRLKAFVEEGDYKGLVKLVDKEHSLILATVKKNQKEDLKKWEKENKRGRK